MRDALSRIGFYFPVYWLVTLGLLIYKGSVLPYPSSALPLEIFGLFPLALLEGSRLFLGHRGNKNEEAVPAGLFLGLSFVSIAAYLFYCLWQTYVLILDVALNAFSLFFLLGQTLTGIFLLIALKTQV